MEKVKKGGRGRRHVIAERICGKGDLYRKSCVHEQHKKEISKVKSELHSEGEDSHMLQNELTMVIHSKHNSSPPPWILEQDCMMEGYF